MCEANVFFASNDAQDKKELFMESVDQIVPEGENQWRLVNIFGEQKVIKGKIKSMSLVDHKIIFETTNG